MNKQQAMNVLIEAHYKFVEAMKAYDKISIEEFKNTQQESLSAFDNIDPPPYFRWEAAEDYLRGREFVKVPNSIYYVKQLGGGCKVARIDKGPCTDNEAIWAFQIRIKDVHF
jgi:hypothetical protein